MRQTTSLSLCLVAMSGCGQSYESDVAMMTTTEMNTALNLVEQTLSQDHRFSPFITGLLVGRPVAHLGTGLCGGSQQPESWNRV